MSERARLEAELGIALDETDVARLSRARGRGASHAELVEEILVHETWFFRDPPVFEALVSELVPRPGKLRVLSAPCSTGEEAYSVAVALLEAGRPPGSFEIVGVDVSEGALETARRATFPAPSFRSASRAWETRWLEASGAGGRALVAEARTGVRFRAANLVAEATLVDEGVFDAVLCRNLIVYLTPLARAQLSRTLSRLVAADGVLFLGHAEQLAGFERSGPPGALMFRAASGIVRTSPALERRPMAAASTSARPPDPSVVVQPTEAPPPAPTSTAQTWRDARALADAGALSDAAALCNRLLERGGHDAETYALLGTVESARGRGDEALRCWQRALYLDPTHAAAAVQLAAALRARGEGARADALLRSVRRAVPR